MDHCIFRLKFRNIHISLIRRNVFDKFLLDFFRSFLFFFHEIFFSFFLFVSTEDISDTFRNFFLKTFCTVDISLIDCYALDHRSVLFCSFHFLRRLFFIDRIRIFYRCKFWNKLTVIFFFFFSRQHSHSVLEIQCLHNVFSVTEPENHFITKTQTLLSVSILIIQFCQFIRPALCKFFLFVFFQDSDLFIQRNLFFLADFVLEDISGVIIWCNLQKFLIKFFCFADILHLEGYFN